MDSQQDQIGYMKNHFSYCQRCSIFEQADIPLYRVNVYPYRQNCRRCGEILCDGQSDYWPELFTGPNQ